MRLEPHEYHEALAQLAWQVELGADEAIGAVGVDRYAEKTSPKAVDKTVEKHVDTPVYVTTEPSNESARLAAGCGDLEALRAALEGFDGCGLKRGARSTVFSDGSPAARVMIVGEAPDKDEDMQGRPFVGKSGQLLDKMLAAIGLGRNAESPEDAVYITNVLPWRPPQNREPLPDENTMMKPFLMRHIELVKPEVLLLVGDLSNQVLLNTNQRVARVRGQLHEVSGIPALPLFHPDYLLRTPAKKREAWADLLMLKTRLDEG